MESITVSGILENDCEVVKDKKGFDQIRFIVICDDTDFYGKQRRTIYRCLCYNTNFKNLKQGDLVFLTGKFTVSQHWDKEQKKHVIDFDVFVTQMANGLIIR